jgi:hypothetical protein
MKITKRTMRHLIYVATAFMLIVATTIPMLVGNKASAAIVDSRSIQLSSSAVSATGVIYKVSWTVPSTNTVKGIVVDFCSNSPIVGDACTAPTGFSVTGFGVANASPNIAAWATTGSDANTVVLSNSTGLSFTGSSTATFEITGVTNTSTLGTFYGRILTYASDTVAQAYAPATPGAYVDYGGIAMSTASELSITAKVQETLTFCVYTSASCGGGGTAVPLGDANGVLSNTSISYQNANPKFNLASNATHGVTVRVKGATLTSGANTITAQGATCTADSTTPSVEQFGMRATTTSPITVDPVYACSAGNHALDTAATVSTYGDVLASTTGALDTTTVPMEFSAKSATATEAGIYTSTFTFIATGSY